MPFFGSRFRAMNILEAGTYVTLGPSQPLPHGGNNQVCLCSSAAFFRLPILGVKTQRVAPHRAVRYVCRRCRKRVEWRAFASHAVLCPRQRTAKKSTLKDGPLFFEGTVTAGLQEPLCVC